MLRELDRQADVLERSGFSGERLRAPEELVARLRPRFAEFGITRLAEITHLDHVGWPVWAAIRPNSPILSVCQGKGPTAGAAQASAVMEAVELAVAERVVPARVASAEALAASGERFDALPAAVRRGRAAPAPRANIGWIAGHDLAADERVWVPVEAVRMNGSDPGRAHWQSTDGVGSGSTMLEAVTHGLLERVERDAEELAQLRSDGEIAGACLDPAALSPEVAALARAVEAAGLHLRVFDITSDLGIPAAFATVCPPPDGHEASWTRFDLMSGTAARPDLSAAVLAAVGEALQSRLTTISGARDDIQPWEYGSPIAPDLLVYPRAAPVGAPARPAAGKPCRAPNRQASRRQAPHRRAPRRHPLRDVLARLDAAAVGAVIAVPLHEDEDFAVAKLVVPGLELPPGARAAPHGARFARAAASRP